MNAILFSAIWGIIMMFSGVFIKNRQAPRYLAMVGGILLFLVNGMELYTGHPIFQIDTKDMLRVDSFNLTFIAIVSACTTLFFFLSGRDVEKAGEHVGEYFALIFFVLCGVALSSTYNTLLLLFLGIEIISIPLYILTGSDKKNLKSNEAALKYFLMGSFSTGLMLMGIALIYGARGSFGIDNM